MGLLDHLRHGAFGEQVAVDDEREAMAAFGLVHVVRGDQERQSLPGELMNLLPEFAAGLGVHAGGGLVEQQQSRLVDHARRQGQPLLPAAGEMAGELVAPVRQAEPFEALAHGPSAVLHGVHPRDEVEVLRDAQVLPEAEPLRHVADVAFDRLALADDVVAQARAAAVVGPQQAAEHADERRLAAAVGAEEAADLARADLEVDVVDGREVAEPLGHPVHIDGKIVSHTSRPEFHVHRLARMQASPLSPGRTRSRS